ncbi:hypothetical protein BC624_107166 [Flavobacterium granuli]|uniref:Transmembrane protein n=1 Tax=Flavobacterium granuli TaxID=280093 RepID=A0A1M5QC12_9FLAO|nr:hypothetical protein BC624_107166 [Flavobacterium granuli]SHH11635.1 hypothetical protein SAMN05443373_107166 [Flavobacterium granuli]
MVCFIFSYYIFMHSSIAFFCFQFYKKKYQPALYIIFAVGLIVLFMVFFYEISTEFIYKNCFLYISFHQEMYQFQFATLSGRFVCKLGTIQILEHYRAQKKEANKVLLINQVHILGQIRFLLICPYFLLYKSLYSITVLNIKFQLVYN